MIKFRQTNPHRPSCVALAQVKDGLWKTPWGMIEKFYEADSRGIPRLGNRRWWQIICNDPNCAATITFSEESLLEELPLGKKMKRLPR